MSSKLERKLIMSYKSYINDDYFSLEVRNARSNNDLKKYKELLGQVKPEEREKTLEREFISILNKFRVSYIYQFLEFLINEGIDPNYGERFGDNSNNTALHWRVAFERDFYVDNEIPEENFDASIYELLLKSISDINKLNSYNETALDIAIQQEHPAAIKFLRKHGGKTSKELEERTD